MNGISQEKLAELTSCSRVTISRYENNKNSRFDLKVVVNICNVLEIEVKDLEE